MKQSRRQKTIAVLESLVRQDAEEISRRLSAERSRLEEMQSVQTRQQASLQSALNETREKLKAGSKLNLSLLNVARTNVSLQTQLCETSQNDLDAVIQTVDTVRTELQQQHRRLERYADLGMKEYGRLVTQHGKTEEKEVDELWLGATREGRQQ